MILRRLFRFVTAAVFGRAWAQKSPKWVGVLTALLFLRYLDRRSNKAHERAKRRA